ncbi:MAG: hypothetical protein E6Q66_04690 [Pedobacter sp.]|nr:MAG: hypothetical protein E6Q66_04690 [Pedobacter sp.]
MQVIKPKQISGETALDRITRAWLSHDLDGLSDADKQLLDRISEADKQLQHGKLIRKNGKDFSRPMRVKELAEWLVERFKISLRQAYIDIETAKAFFLSTQSRNDKEFARGQMIQYGEEFMCEAAARGDFKAAAAFFKELRLLHGLDKVDVETPNLSQWEPATPVIVSDPSALGFEKIEHPDQLVQKLLKSLKQSPAEPSTIDHATN